MIVRIGFLQFVQGNYLKELAYNQQTINQIISPKRGNIQVCCPFHKNGQERKPSATISLQDQKNFDGKIIKAGTFHCFACGTTCDITQMISHCFQKEIWRRIRRVFRMARNGRS